MVFSTGEHNLTFAPPSAQGREFKVYKEREGEKGRKWWKGMKKGKKGIEKGKNREKRDKIKERGGGF